MLEYNQLFEETPLKNIGVMVKRRVDEALDSKIEQAKSLRIQKTNNFMRQVPNPGEYKGRIGYYAPIFWSSVRNDQAAIKSAFNNNPFVTIVPMNETPQANAEQMQKLVNWNVVDTDHRSNFYSGTDDVAQVGTGILKNRYRIRPMTIPTAIPGPTGETQIALLEQNVGNDYTEKVNLQNYLQDTSALGNDFFTDGCKWVAELKVISIIDLVAMSQDEGINERGLIKTIEKCKNAKRSQKSHTGSTYTQPTQEGADVDFDMGVVAFEMYGLFPIEKSEDSTQYFKVVYCEDTNEVLQIKPVYDHPFTIIKAIPRNDSYLGIGNSESIGNNQILQNFITNKGLENLIANLQRIIFYAKDAFDPNDIQYKSNGAFVPTNMQKMGYQQISQILQEFQGRDTNVGTLTQFLALLNDHRQIATTQSDMYTKGVKSSLGGGLNSTGMTATGANIVEQNRSVVGNDMYNQIAICQEKHWNKKVLSLQINSPDFIIVRVTLGQPETLRRYMIMGSFDAKIKSGLSTNKQLKYNIMRDWWAFFAQVMPAAVQSGQINDFNYRAFIRDAMDVTELPDKDIVLPPVPAIQTQPLAAQTMAQPQPQTQLQGVV